MTDSNRKTGDQAELLAINYLQKHEYEVIETNFVASKGGEIDIIAKKDSITVFFEVKYRTGESHGNAVETFTTTKKKRFLFAVKWYCMKHGLREGCYRVDFIAIQKMKTSHRLTHFKNVEMN
ncbi:MAG: YraN family protein [Candidatus Gracilibacteria bacterium]|nr:YraN family protein [Candidatus Gracilibacteria bacterium]